MQQAPEAALHGFNARMGVASGFVPADTHICRCALMQLAKGARAHACPTCHLSDAYRFSVWVVTWMQSSDHT